MRPRSILVATLVVVGAVGMLLSPALAATHVQITSEDSTPVPERPFEFEGDTYQLDSVILAESNDTINVSVTGLDGEYRVLIYNTKEQVVNSRPGEGDEDFTFNLLQYELGTYAVAVYQDEEYQAIEPLVVEAYDVSVEAPDRIVADENASVRIDIDRTGATENPHRVTAVLSGEGDEILVNATRVNGAYTATVEAGTLESGNYTVYGLARSERTAFGRKEIVGVSDRVSLSVAEPTPTPTPTATPEPTPTATPSAESTPTATPTPTATATPEPTGTATPAPTATPTGTPETAAPAITPNTAQQPATTSDGGPGFTALATAVGVVLGVALLARRSRR